MTVEVVNEPAPVKYVSMTSEKVKLVFDSHVSKGQVVREYVLAVGHEKTR